MIASPVSPAIRTGEPVAREGCVSEKAATRCLAICTLVALLASYLVVRDGVTDRFGKVRPVSAVIYLPAVLLVGCAVLGWHRWGPFWWTRRRLRLDWRVLASVGLLLGMATYIALAVKVGFDIDRLPGATGYYCNLGRYPPEVAQEHRTVCVETPHLFAQSGADVSRAALYLIAAACLAVDAGALRGRSRRPAS